MVDLGTYLTWTINPKRDNHRLLLIEAGYADKDVIFGHGRSNYTAVLNPVTAMSAQQYPDNNLDVLFTQPTSQEGYSWEIWQDGFLVNTTSGGSFLIQTTLGQHYQFAVASVRGTQYSKPWIVEFTRTSGSFILYGSLGDWNDVGTGTGASGTGTVKLASYPWVSDEFIPYDNFLTSDPEIEQSLYNFSGVGDFKAMNLIPDELRWENLYWRGHKCDFYYGDETWPREDFYLVGSAVIGDFRMVGDSEYQFDLIDGGYSLSKSFPDDYTNTNVGAGPSFDLIATLGSLEDINLSAVGGTKREMLCDIDAYTTSDGPVGDALRIVANSVNLYLSQNADETIRVLSKDPESLAIRTFKSTLSEDEIAEGEVIMGDTIPAYRRVVLELADGTPVGGSTTASTGVINETVTIKTVLVNEADAQVILQEYIDYYSVSHRVWQIGILQVAGQFFLGDLVTVDHHLLQATGVVTMIKSSPMTSYYTIDLEII